MSQFDITEESSPVAAGVTETKGEAVAPTAVAPAAVIARSPMRGTFQQFSQPRTTLIQPAGVVSGEAIADSHRRRVGVQYLWQLALTAIPLIIIDLVLLTLSIVVARAIVMYFAIGTGINITAYFLPIATGFLLVAAELGLYPGMRLSPVEEFRGLAVSVTAMFAMWMVSVAIARGGLASNQPIFLVLAYVFSMITLPVFRGTARRLLGRFRWWGFPTLVCGDDAVAVKVYHWLASNSRLGLRPVGVIADPEVLETGDEPWYAGQWADARDMARRRGVYWAVVVPPETTTTDIGTTITEYLSTIPHIHILSELTGLPDHWSRHQQIDGLTGIHLQQNLLLPLPRMSKRILDIVLTLVGGLLLLPLLFYIAVAVKMSSRGPVLYANERIGRDGRRFRMWKFRSMFTNGDAVLENYLEAYPEYREEYETTQKLKWDPRITRIGRFIRKTSLDELPQLWNVLRGEMSLVGPRPILLDEQARYGDYYWLYTMVSPGITGLWQVSGRNNTTYEERLQLVAYYVRNWSLWLDIYLLLKTVRIVLFGGGAY